MASVCQNCGELAVDVDEDVCKSCGAVTEGIQFDNSFNPFCSNTKPKLHLWPKKQNSAGLEYGISILDNLGHKYNLSSDIKADIINLLKEVYATMSFARKQDVAILGGCCLIHVLKKSRQFVSITDLCSKLKCSKKRVFKFSKVIKNHLSECSANRMTNRKTIEDDPDEPDCMPLNFSEKLESSIPAMLASVSVDNKAKLIFKTTALTKLASSCWLVSGRSPEGVIVAAAYLCWKSMHPCRRTLTFKRFCSEFSLPQSKAQPRVAELKELLLKLGRHVPSFTKDYVNEKNFLFHLDYILSNSETLRNDLLSNEFNAEEIDKKEFSAFRKSRSIRKGNKSDIRTERKPDYDPDLSSDIEISDTEILTYIRSDEQIELMKALREK